MSSIKVMSDLHSHGVVCASERIKLVNVTPMKGGYVGLLVENEGAFQSAALTECEARHVASLILSACAFAKASAPTA